MCIYRSVLGGSLSVLSNVVKLDQAVLGFQDRPRPGSLLVDEDGLTLPRQLTCHYYGTGLLRRTGHEFCLILENSAGVRRSATEPLTGRAYTIEIRA